MQLSTILAAVKTAPNYRAQVECNGVTLEVFGAPGKFRWTFDYLIRRPIANDRPRYAYGRRNAEMEIDKWPTVEINTSIHTFV